MGVVGPPVTGPPEGTGVLVGGVLLPLIMPLGGGGGVGGAGGGVKLLPVGGFTGPGPTTTFGFCPAAIVASLAALSLSRWVCLAS